MMVTVYNFLGHYSAKIKWSLLGVELVHSQMNYLYCSRRVSKAVHLNICQQQMQQQERFCKESEREGEMDDLLDCGMGEGLPETSSHYRAARCHAAHWSAQPPESQQCLHGRRREGGLTGGCSCIRHAGVLGYCASIYSLLGCPCSGIT